MTPDTFVVVVRWTRGSEEFKNAVSCDVTLDPHGICVQIVYLDGHSDRFPQPNQDRPLGVKIRNL